MYTFGHFHVVVSQPYGLIPLADRLSHAQRQNLAEAAERRAVTEQT